MKPRHKRLILYGSALLIVFLASTPLALNRVFNQTDVKLRIVRLLNQKAGLQIKPETFHISVFPSIQARVQPFEVPLPLSAGLEGTALSADSLEISLDLSGLIKGNQFVRRIILNTPRLNMPRINKPSAPHKAKSGVNQDAAELSQAGFSDKQKPGTQKPDKYKIDPSAPPAEPSTNAYNATYEKFTRLFNHLFDLLPQFQDSMDIVVNNAQGPCCKDLDATIYLSKKNRLIFVEARINDIHAGFSDIFRAPSHPNFKFSSVSARQADIVMFIENADHLKASLSLMGPVIRDQESQQAVICDAIKGEIQYTQGIWTAKFDPFKADYPHATIGATGTWNPSKNHANLTVTGSDIIADQAREMVDRLIATYVSDTIFSILHEGHVPHITLSFSGQSPMDMLDGHHLELQGTATKGKVRIPETHLTADQVSARVQLKKGVLTISEVTGQIGRSRIKSGDLSIHLLQYHDIPFHGRFFIDADLPELPAILTGLLPGTILSRELSRVHHVNGRCNAELTLDLKHQPQTSGRPSNRMPDVIVETRDFTVTGQYDRIPGNISLQNARFRLQDGIVTLDKVTGTINSSLIKDMNAVVDINKDTFAITSGSGKISIETTIPWLLAYEKTRQMISPVKQGSGALIFDSLTMTGPWQHPEKWRFNTECRGNDIQISTMPAEPQIRGLSFRAKVSQHGINASNILFISDDHDWLSGLVPSSVLDTLAKPVHLADGHIHIDGQSSAIEARLSPLDKKQVEVSLFLSGKKLQNLELRELRCKDPGFTDARLIWPSSLPETASSFEMTGIVDSRTLKKLMLSQSPVLKAFHEITCGRPITVQATPKKNFRISADCLDLESLMNHLDSKTQNPKNVSSKTLILDVGQLHYKTLIFDHVATHISIRENQTYIRVDDAGLCGLSTSGYINRGKKNIVINLPLHAKQRDNIQDLLSCLLKKEDFMNGIYSVESHLQASGNVEELSRRFQGDFNFNATDGRIHKLTLLSRILSLINVSQVFKGKIPDITQEGFAYNRVDIEADVIDSVLHLKKAVIDGRDMTMIFTGQIDPLKDELNLTCLVAPFKTVDLIIEKIPIINTLLGGRLISIPVKATGKLSDPVVIPLHPSSVGKGVINIMTDILKTPVKLFEKLTTTDDTATQIN